MKEMLLVGIGGFAGSVARYLLGAWMGTGPGHGRFPLATFLINVSGCLLVGLLAAIADRSSAFTPQIRLLLITGLLGGFTTFSAFGLETTQLLRRGEVSTALVYSIASVLVGVAAVWIGFRAGSLGRG